MALSYAETITPEQIRKTVPRAGRSRANYEREAELRGIPQASLQMRADAAPRPERPAQIEYDPDLVRRIAEHADITIPAVYARIRRGDTGERLWRLGGNQGRRKGPPVVAKPASVGARAWNSLERRASDKGIPLATLQARIDAGWPEDRLLDDVQKWRRRRW
jgi:hypothetical protein